MPRFRLATFLAFFFGLECLALLQVFPTRVVLDDKKRVATLSLRHGGKKPGRYRVTAVFYRMKPDGSLELVDKPENEKASIARFLRFSPKETLIPPSLEQVLRVMFAGPRNLPEGDYRAHLHFEPMGESEDSKVLTSGGKIGMKLEARLALAIPVIFHRGKPSFTVTLQKPTIILKPNKSSSLDFKMQVAGNGIPYGDLFAFFTPKGGSEVPIGIVRGIASYIPERNVSMGITPPKNVLLSNGKLRLEFREPEEQGGTVISSLETLLP